MPTIKDLKWTGVREERSFPTKEFYINRTGRKVFLKELVTYIPTRGCGTMKLDDWYEAMEAAVEAEGKTDLLKGIEEHVRRHCAWLRKERQVRQHALECLSGENYLAWDGFNAEASQRRAV